jgi:hypothetical protein
MPTRTLSAIAALALLGCSAPERPGGIAGVDDFRHDASAEAGLLFDADLGNEKPPSRDASGFCGNDFFQATQDPPNLYFVIDRSGSMGSMTVLGSRYSVMRSAAIELVKTLGSRANIGAAIFPAGKLVTGCEPGEQVLATRPGDPPGTGSNGPTTQAFSAAISVYPVGGTPLSSTLVLLTDELKKLPGKTVVLLATDGGPNCNGSITCTSVDCIQSIEGATVGGQACNILRNCCDPKLADGPGAFGCLDSVSTVQAVDALRASGIRTFVVGMPGSGPYASLLDQLALVGGTGRSSSPYYYRVDDVSALASVLAAIGVRALATCEFKLDKAPPDSKNVNVYVDGQVLVYGEKDGWSWKSAASLVLNGESCRRLEEGLITEVQVVAGCPTEVPR